MSDTARSPEISVIVCTYNRPVSLHCALASVLSQDVQDFEVLVVDDGSEPPVVPPAVADDRVQLIRKPHGGPGAARASGLHAARGRLIAYCDDDDIWRPNHLQLLLD